MNKVRHRDKTARHRIYAFFDLLLAAKSTGDDFDFAREAEPVVLSAADSTSCIGNQQSGRVVAESGACGSCLAEERQSLALPGYRRRQCSVVAVDEAVEESELFRAAVDAGDAVALYRAGTSDGVVAICRREVLADTVGFSTRVVGGDEAVVRVVAVVVASAVGERACGYFAGISRTGGVGVVHFLGMANSNEAQS